MTGRLGRLLRGLGTYSVPDYDDLLVRGGRRPVRWFRLSALLAAAAVVVAGLVVTDVLVSARPERAPADPARLVVRDAGHVDHRTSAFTGAIDTPCGTIRLEHARFELDVERPDDDRWVARILLSEGRGTVVGDGERPIVPGRWAFLAREIRMQTPAAPSATAGAGSAGELSRRLVETAPVATSVSRMIHVLVLDPADRSAVGKIDVELEWRALGERCAVRATTDEHGVAAVAVPVDAVGVRGRSLAGNGFAESDWCGLGALAGVDPERPFLLRAFRAQPFDGVVCDVDGEPVAGATVLWVAPGNDDSIHLVAADATDTVVPAEGVHVARADASGRFRIPLGGVPVVAQAFVGGRSSAPHAVERVADGAPRPAPERFALRELMAIAVDVTRPDGGVADAAFARLLETCDIASGARSWTVCRHLPADAAGVFRLADVPRDSAMQLRFGAAGFAPKTCRVPAAIGPALRVEARLDPPARIAGHVRSASGPVAGAVVTAWTLSEPTDPVARTETGDDGGFDLGPLLSAEYELRVQPVDPTLVGRSVRAVFAAAEPAPVDVELAAGHALSGRVLDASGHARAHEPLILRTAYTADPDAIPVERFVMTDARGEFAVDGMPAGLLRVRWLGNIRGTLVQSDSRVTLRR